MKNGTMGTMDMPRDDDG
jgi:hypothetical protein